MAFYQYRDVALETIARNIIKKYDASLLFAPVPIPVEDIMEQQYGLRIEFQYIRNNGRILGETVFDDTLVAVYDEEYKMYTLIPAKSGTVFIDASLIACRKDGRFCYTCAHELGHYVLHQDIYTGSGLTAAMFDDQPKKSTDTDKAIERQADRLGCFLLMPAGTVKMAFHRFGRNQSDPILALSKVFEVSRAAMQYRLKEMGLLG
ncbi:MAG: ImmA/IrrE family metallo-endopeptidase [Oscillospiraceae bacterium]|jgi:Zn-dependent peptidase ImmA (M78 family)|nr:ImmA/IrrE family metallo-endopeptidase [Oscillospiraceae bacterium]